MMVPKTTRAFFFRRQIMGLKSSNHLQMQSVKPKDLAMAIKWGVPGYACCPPATSGMGRHLGQAEWHGDAQYTEHYPFAATNFTPVETIRNPSNAPFFRRLR